MRPKKPSAKRKARKPREWWLVTWDGIDCQTEPGSRWATSDEAASAYWNTPKEIIKVREVLKPRRKTK